MLSLSSTDVYKVPFYSLYRKTQAKPYSASTNCILCSVNGPRRLCATKLGREAKSLEVLEGIANGTEEAASKYSKCET